MVRARVGREPSARHGIDGQSPGGRYVARPGDERRPDLAGRPGIEVHRRLGRRPREIEDHHPPARHAHIGHLRCGTGRHSPRPASRMEGRFLEAYSRPVLDCRSPGARAVRARHAIRVQQPRHGGALVRDHRITERRGHSHPAERPGARPARRARAPLVHRIRPGVRGGRAQAVRELGRRHVSPRARRRESASS